MPSKLIKKYSPLYTIFRREMRQSQQKISFNWDQVRGKLNQQIVQGEHRVSQEH